MLVRIVVAVSLPLALVACANDHPTSAQLMPTASLAASASVVGSARLASATQEPIMQLPRKTMSDRVLTAIALERVTGMKPDPARLTH